MVVNLGSFDMVTRTVSVARTVPSDTLNVNSTGVSRVTSGAKNVVARAAGSPNVMGSVLLCDHRYVSTSPGFTAVAVPLRDTVSPSDTVWVLPASMVG